MSDLILDKTLVYEKKLFFLQIFTIGFADETGYMLYSYKYDVYLKKIIMSNVSETFLHFCMS